MLERKGFSLACSNYYLPKNRQQQQKSTMKRI